MEVDILQTVLKLNILEEDIVHILEMSLLKQVWGS